MGNDVRRPEHPGIMIHDDYLLPNKMSQTEFAKRAGISYFMISKIVNGKRRITAEVAQKIEQAHGISADLLLSMQERHDVWTPPVEVEQNLSHDSESENVIELKKAG
ncbi:MAG: addiction module antidote protein, HigA family [Bdellovibrionaceae bacterium]|nr:addiction module antidote protein, HigA family [Pseudobdellovibrionaceae bacterium]|tara:strand:+ start:137 stop:457 length:321 start_codon:yes stop_codon:yes gene_type:complete